MNESELLEEIQKLNEQITIDKLKCRKLKESDWDTLVSWWKWWRWAIMPKDFLPDNGKGGIIVEKDNTPIVAGFLYETNSSMLILEWIISNPKYKDDDRKEAIGLLIKEAENKAKLLNYKHMFTIGRSKHLTEKHKELGWLVDNKPSYEIIKKIV